MRRISASDHLLLVQVSGQVIGQVAYTRNLGNPSITPVRECPEVAKWQDSTGWTLTVASLTKQLGDDPVDWCSCLVQRSRLWRLTFRDKYVGDVLVISVLIDVPIGIDQECRAAVDPVAFASSPA